MAEPRIQFVKSGGVSLAYVAIGDGEPLIFLWNPHSNIQQQWAIPEFRSWYEQLSEGRMLILPDYRGTGLSQRDVSDISIEALEEDISALADKLGLETFALFATFTIGPVAISYAAHHPKRVRKLVCWHAYVSGRDYTSPQGKALGSLVANWDLYTDTLARFGLGFSGGEAAKRFAATIRDGITHEMFLAYHTLLRQADVTELLPQVQAATLVLHRSEVQLIDADTPTLLASSIPNAQLVVLEGESGGFALGDSDAVLAAIDDFLSEGDVSTGLGKGPDVHTILFTDMESSTALTQRLGDTAAQEVRRAHNAIVRSALELSRGSEIKHTGDGIMASFTTASSALDCAIAIQQGVASHKDEHPDSPLGVYIGLNAGEPIAEDDDLFGTSINLAARICDHAEAGQILAANVVRELAAGKDYLFADLGETELRGFEDPIKLWELRWQGED